MLNALRHHGGGHQGRPKTADEDAECSTPYDITAEVTTANEGKTTIALLCSTPYGITAEVTT